MFSAIRQSNLMLAGLILFIVGVVLCPHGTHAAPAHVHSDVAEDAHADCDHEPVEHSSNHDHDHCEFDAGHSHDFRLLSSPTYQPYLQVVAIMPFHQVSKTCTTAKASVLRVPGVQQTPLLALDSIRLRI